MVEFVFGGPENTVGRNGVQGRASPYNSPKITKVLQVSQLNPQIAPRSKKKGD